MAVGGDEVPRVPRWGLWLGKAIILALCGLPESPFFPAPQLLPVSPLSLPESGNELPFSSQMVFPLVPQCSDSVQPPASPDFCGFFSASDKEESRS